MAKRKRKTAVTGADLMFAPMVAMMRLPLMSAEASNPAALPTETMKAGAEKFAAFVEGHAVVLAGGDVGAQTFDHEHGIGGKSHDRSASPHEQASALKLPAVI